MTLNFPHPACCPLPAARSHRRGISLIEVLVAMGVLALGLLGAAALFPVGGYYMQTGDVADRSDAIAQAALNDAVTRGWLNPKNWMTVNLRLNNVAAYPTAAANASLSVLDSEPTITQFQGLMRAHDYIGGTLAAQNSVPAADINQQINRQCVRSRACGAAYVIDPMWYAAAVGAGALNYTDPTALSLISRFPATPEPQNLNLDANRASWWPWCLTGGVPTWPIQRVTVPGINAAAQFPRMGTADFMSRASDDLALTLPSKADSPAQQNYFANGTSPVGRQSAGNLSYVISVVPTTPEGRDAIGTSPASHSYDVSAVVFNKRILPTIGAGSTTARDDMASNERLVQAQVVSRGVNGGELLLTRRPAPNGSQENPEDPFKEFKAGQWVMLCGPQPTSTNLRPMFFMQWYKVLSVEDSMPSNTTFNPTTQRLVSLRGPDWPWTGAEPISQDLRVGIFPSIVAVHTKTMRLEAGSEWSVE